MPKSLAEILGEQSHGGYAPGVSAASLRAPLRGEILPITVTTTSKRFAVPADWRNRLVRIQADGGDVFVQVSLGNDALVDIAARAAETNNAGTIALAPSTSNGCFLIPSGTWLDVPFPRDAQTFALIASAACVARCHPSET